MVPAKQVTAEYCHINPVRGEISQGATEMPEQNQKNTNPATKPSNEMPLKILLFYCLFQTEKNQNLKNNKMGKRGFSSFGGGLAQKCGRELERWEVAELIWREQFDHTHTNIQFGCTESFFPCFASAENFIKNWEGGEI